MKKIKVVIVDDSIVIQTVLSAILNSDPEIIVVGLADNPIVARSIIKTLKPDVLVLDVEMPEMDGLTFLEKLMRLHPLPVVMCSVFTPHCREVTIEAFRLGATDVISKPILESDHQEIIAKIKNAAHTKINSSSLHKENKLKPLQNSPSIEITNNYVFAIGASTGGIEALKVIFDSLPKSMPPIIVIQHLPNGFVDLFAQQINKTSKLIASEAQDGEKLKPGHIYLAKTGLHLEIEQKNNEKFIRYREFSKINGHKPSIDVMMKSVAEAAGNHSVGIILSGMGSDGANGMLALKKAGATTIAQDEESSVVWGMPKVAIDLDAVKYVLPLHQIPHKMLECLGVAS